ncbi:transposase [Plakobranchus ocellatus]|uniref:Transposase n=1 Tax=Plakobranchus ocellatus TaxID=259542 RepID=A0AAV3Z2Q2_9GAST|nr:transposase [Plakobranchus ocellatus]
MTWKHPSSPVTKKFKVQRSAAKVMATVFWDAKGVILLDILPQGNAKAIAYYSYWTVRGTIIRQMTYQRQNREVVVTFQKRGSSSSSGSLSGTDIGDHVPPLISILS